MPKNRKAFRLTADYVEMLHGFAVPAYASERVSGQSLLVRDRALLESACARPFQTAFGRDGYPTILEKAAVLFHGLIANHAFYDGNKRTAVLALNLFLSANDYLWGLLPEEMYELAIETAAARANDISLDDILAKILGVLTAWAVPFDALRKDRRFAKVYEQQLEMKKAIRNHKLNRLIKPK